MDVAIIGAVVSGIMASAGIVLVNRAAIRRRIDHAVRG
jgi:hypothetical protein